jgi:tetratricopeptide (TPR) repeat protein
VKRQTAAMEIPAIPVEEGVRLMVGDLERGRRFDKAVLLFAVYRAETTRAQAEALLEASLREMGFRIERVRFPLAGEPDWPYRLRFHPSDGDTTFFVYDLNKAFPEILQYLNYRREIFTEERVWSIFWVLEEEARRLALEAPDFWAFRTQVLEFLEVSPPARRVEIARELVWWGWHGVPYAYESPEEIEERIVLRERLLAELGDVEETIAARAELHYTLGGLYRFKRGYKEALKHAQQVKELAKQIGNERLETWAWNTMGNVYDDLGRYHEAIAEYKRAIELDPKYALPHTGIGNVYARLDRHEEAMAEYRRAIELDPKDAYPHNGLATVYARLGRYDDAITEFEKAIELDPKYALLYTGLGNVYYELGRYDDAIAKYERAVELDSKDAYPHNGFGNVYYELGCYEDAIAEFEKTIGLDPKLATTHTSLASIYRKLGKQTKFERHSQRARELLTPDDHYNWACLEAICGNTERALEQLKRALEKRPGLREWAKRDPDLEWIREDERFWELLDMNQEVVSS